MWARRSSTSFAGPFLAAIDAVLSKGDAGGDRQAGAS